MSEYYIWTVGCQMNKAETARLDETLRQHGLSETHNPADASVIILNTCVVRQNAENKVVNKLRDLASVKKANPGTGIVVTGCMVNSNVDELSQRFPYVDLFFNPQHAERFEPWLARRNLAPQARDVAPRTSPQPVTAYVPVIQGCNNFCAYCIVPLRRGREKSRPIAEIRCEVKNLVHRGAREVTLLGQNVNSYGKDLSPQVDLAGLIGAVHDMEGLLRVRFLTSHPRDVDESFIAGAFSLPKVCRHISLPVQSGDDDVLRAMNRNYTVEAFRRIVARLRSIDPDFAISTDLIVGFPGETERHFDHSLGLLSDLKLDTVHVACYSPRRGTASSKIEDDVPAAEKDRRRQAIETLQTANSLDINRRFIGRRANVLVEGSRDGKWFGRTSGDKLVFFKSGADCRGRLVSVEIASASAWSLQGCDPDVVSG